MRRIVFIHLLSIVVLIIGGILFVKANRHESTVKIIENLKDKDVVFYSSNLKRAYINFKTGETPDMEKLCTLGLNYMKENGINASSLKIEPGDLDPYSLSGVYLDKNLMKDKKYILVDLNRNMTKHGSKYKGQNGNCCPISIILSKKSKSYDQSLLFAGRVKSLIDKKYTTLPVHIISTDSEDYNQSKGYIGMLVELGDAANTYDEARESLKILCDAMTEVINVQTQ